MSEDFTFDDMNFKAVLFKLNEVMASIEIEEGTQVVTEPYAVLKIYEDWGKGRLEYIGTSHVEFRHNGNIDVDYASEDEDFPEEFGQAFEEVILERLKKSLPANKDEIVGFDNETVYTELSEGKHHQWMVDLFDDIVKEYLTESKDDRFNRLVQFKF